MGVNSQANDAMIRRLENELEERNSFVQGTIANAQDAERDLNDTEKTSLAESRSRMTAIKEQLDELERTADIARDVANRAKQIDHEITLARKTGGEAPVEYRSTGEYLVDYVAGATGSKSAMERLEVFTRAAAHQKTSDNLGVVPDPIFGNVLNFIDASRPVANALGPIPMPSATWHRPKVTQHASVAVQGSAGAAADEKTELVSQKMTITRLDGTAVTYGGYVNVSRQNIDFSSPQMFDAIVNDLAANYAIQTEAALGTALNASTNNVELTTASGGTPTATELVNALWTAVGNIYTAMKGQGRVILAVPPGKLGSWGSLFAPINPVTAQSPGFAAADFNTGLMGNVSGVPLYVTSGLSGVLATTYGLVLSTAAVEVYEQRIGTLQVTEPSVLGVQVAYAGYFTPMTVETGGLQKIVNLA